MDFSSRSHKKELLDRDDIPFEDIRQNMQELEAINRYLGGHRITVKGVSQILSLLNTEEKKQHAFIVCEIGCGGGDNLKALAKWFSKKNIAVQFIGIDINADCISYAKENCRNLSLTKFITADYKQVKFNNKPDIIFSSLFCHHFTGGQLTEILHWCKQNAAMGFFMNDLHRHFLAYYAIKFLTQIFSHSYLVKNDAPLSVARGFRRNELISLLKNTDIHPYKISWRWAFRWLVVVNI